MAEMFGYVLGFLVSVTAGLLVISLQVAALVAVTFGCILLIKWVDSKTRR